MRIQKIVAMSLKTTLRPKLKRKKIPKNTLIAWGKKYFPHYFEDDPSEQHLFMANRFQVIEGERGCTDVIIGPRGSAKSTIGTFLLPMWAICEDYEKYIILMSDTISQAGKYLESIKEELVNNEELRSAYPHACGEGALWNTNAIVTHNKIMVEALGVGSKIRGRRYRNERPSLICVDDPEGDEAAFSVLKRTRVYDRFTKGVLKAGNKQTNIVVIGSKVHRECLVAKVANMPGWKSAEFRSIIQWPTNMHLWAEWENILFDLGDPDRDLAAKAFYDKHHDEMEAGAKVLWKHRFPLYDLMMKRASGGHPAFESEHQNNPVDPSKVDWGPEYFEGDDIWFSEWPKELQVKTMFLDPSKGRLDKPGDYQAIIKLGVLAGLVYVDADIRRQPLKEMVATTLSHAIGFRPDHLGCEANGFQECIATELEELSKEQKKLIPIVPISNFKVRKEARIRRLSPYVTRRRIRYKRQSPGVTILMDHMRDFPNGEHDDGPDALEGAFRLAIANMNNSASRDFSAGFGF